MLKMQRGRTPSKETVPQPLVSETSRADHSQEQQKLEAGQTSRKEQETAIFRKTCCLLAAATEGSQLYLLHITFLYTHNECLRYIGN